MRSSFFANASAPCLVRQNTIVGRELAITSAVTATRVVALRPPEQCVARAPSSGSTGARARRVALVRARSCRPRRRAWPRTAASGGRRRLVEERAHGGEEAHVGHAVGFVEHHDLDRDEVDLARGR
jgi:hypothetical protein